MISEFLLREMMAAWFRYCKLTTFAGLLGERTNIYTNGSNLYGNQQGDWNLSLGTGMRRNGGGDGCLHLRLFFFLRPPLAPLLPILESLSGVSVALIFLDIMRLIRFCLFMIMEILCFEAFLNAYFAWHAGCTSFKAHNSSLFRF